MQKADEVDELAFFSGFGARGDGNVDFVDARGCAEIAEGLGGVGGGEDGRALPDPQAVNESGWRFRGRERKCGREKRQDERGTVAGRADCGGSDCSAHGSSPLGWRNRLRETAN